MYCLQPIFLWGGGGGSSLLACLCVCLSDDSKPNEHMFLNFFIWEKPDKGKKWLNLEYEPDHISIHGCLSGGLCSRSAL